jgi:hypothetical protein
VPQFTGSPYNECDLSAYYLVLADYLAPTYFCLITSSTWPLYASARYYQVPPGGARCQPGVARRQSVGSRCQPGGKDAANQLQVAKQSRPSGSQVNSRRAQLHFRCAQVARWQPDGGQIPTGHQMTARSRPDWLALTRHLPFCRPE